ncbi:MAG TPA: hypothetical protein VFB96_12190 [Pirellulaceae bacterium]|nr:hypothetical protein [Pirellulaceae bacterium]
MPRLIRWLQKKRGDRRTGSNLVGNVGEAVFYGALFLLGVTALAALLTAHVVQPAAAWYAVGFGFWCVVLVLTSFVILGGAGVLRTAFRIGFSAERRSAMAQSANRIDLVREAVPQPKDFPTLPSHDGLVNSPGTELAYRLPASNPTGWRLLATTIFSLLWNAVGCVLFVIATRGWLDGNVNWFLTAFLIPYLAICGGSIYFVLRQIWIDAGMGPTTVEICSHPLWPARQYQVHLSQSGHIAVKSLSLWLTCDEEVTYHQGTDIRHEVRTVYQEKLYERADFGIEPGIPFQTECTLSIPPTAMHSFQSEHNAVHWWLVVRGSLAYWPKFERRFPIIVYPGEATAAAEKRPVSAPASSRIHARGRSVLSEVSA